MLNNSHFYHRTIRKIVIAFGTIFNEIEIIRFTKDGSTAKEVIKVPLSYGPKEKYLQRITTDPTVSKSVSTVVPRISFEMSGMSYDSDRKRITAGQNFAAGVGSSIKTQYNPIPYNFNFSVSIYVRNIEDGTQIIEQILPFFTPDYSVTVDFISEMQQKFDMPIILNSVTPSIDYQGDFSSTRLILWDLEFTVKGYLWPPIKNSSLITTANTNIMSTTNAVNVNGKYIFTGDFLKQQVLYVDTANGSNEFVDSEVVRSNNKYGTIEYFSNNTQGLVVLSNTNELFEVGDVLKGDISNARYTVNNITVKSDLPTVQITTTIDPSDAELGDDFGFNETIIEND